MAKIDWTSIEGYREDMTADEKLALLENHEPSKPTEPTAPTAPTEPTTPIPKDTKGYVPKAQFDKLASELAATKKNLRSKLTEDEVKEAERLAEQEAIKQELETLRKEKTVSTYKANYLGLGFEEALAMETAEAMAEGDMERVFANMKKHGDAQKKAWTAEVMKNTPAPPAGDENTANLKKLEETNKLRRSMGLPEIKM